MSNELRCIGCGAVLQSEDPNQAGYVPKSSLNKEDVICRRCFRLKHYNEIQDVNMSSDDFLTMLNALSDREGIIVNVIDVFDFQGSWISGLKRIVGQKKVILAANKIDLLPKLINKKRVENWIKHLAKELGMKPDAVVLISAEKNHGIDELLQVIEEERNGQDVYIVGTTNVGKSTLINKLIERSIGEKNVITTSHFPGTTLDLIDIPLGDGTFMYDTPGIIQSHQMTHYVTDDELKVIMPKEEIKPRNFQLNEGQTLFLGGLVRVDYVSGGRRSLNCFVSNRLNIHRTKRVNAEDLWHRQIGELLTPPGNKTFDFNNLKRHTLSVKEQKQDIIISGLGFITVEEGAVLEVYAPKQVDVYLRPSIL
ncbi:ribosome biogenesis GTPase YqeH [Macrococcus bovicus]|uniref:Ribosome biogenesis GTPase YqeH n=1 Tax=Macrococcus bovicus TaxID=69968 RepID=A0A4R6C2L6_9STAP|nr:ribosome biogenesis GTPase YqeH [Macrococcus bovicus]TDM15597.1 ribosome biogenesis GTPase YqeH [Macrococcus bovicus]WJP96985.1 ribosome biogenesis GTPase YqeH [Macrococcus bovicus]